MKICQGKSGKNATLSHYAKHLTCDRRMIIIVIIVFCAFATVSFGSSWGEEMDTGVERLADL